MSKSRVKCSKCKKLIGFISDEYEMNIDIECRSCNKGEAVSTPGTFITASGSYAKTKKGIRVDVHPKYSFKSATEANFARLLNFLSCDWAYEERAFTFADYKTKPHVYIMDFEVKNRDCITFPKGFYEVKGYMTSSARQKFRRMKKHYPSEFDMTTVVLYNKYKKDDIAFCTKIGIKYIFYSDLQEVYSSVIPSWE